MSVRFCLSPPPICSKQSCFCAKISLSLAKFSISIFISRQLAPTPKCQPYDPFKISCESSMFVRVGLWQHDLWQLLYTSSNLWNARNKIRRYGTMKPSQIQKYLHRHFRLCLNRTLSSQDSHIEFLKLRQSLLMFLSSPCGSRLERLSKLQYGSGGRFSFWMLLSKSNHTLKARMICVYAHKYLSKVGLWLWMTRTVFLTSKQRKHLLM